MTTYDGPIFDSDSHIYEEDFAFFNEYLPNKYHASGCRPANSVATGATVFMWASVGGERRFRSEWSCGAAGQAQGMAAGHEGGQIQRRGLDQAHPGIYDRDARLAKLDQFGVEGAVVCPLAISSPLLVTTTRTSGNAVLHAYNRCLDERLEVTLPRIASIPRRCSVSGICPPRSPEADGSSNGGACGRGHADGPVERQVPRRSVFRPDLVAPQRSPRVVSIPCL